MDWLNSQKQIKIFSIVVDKTGKTNEVFELSWGALLMRFENTIRQGNFTGSSNLQEKGIVLSDNTDVEKLTKLMRKMRHYNNVPNNTSFYNEGYRNLKLTEVIEDPVFRNSQNSLLHQMNDVVAYCLRQRYEPNNYMKRKGGHNF